MTRTGFCFFHLIPYDVRPFTSVHLATKRPHFAASLTTCDTGYITRTSLTALFCETFVLSTGMAWPDGFDKFARIKWKERGFLLVLFVRDKHNGNECDAVTRSEIPHQPILMGRAINHRVPFCLHSILRFHLEIFICRRPVGKHRYKQWIQWTLYLLGHSPVDTLSMGNEQTPYGLPNTCFPPNSHSSVYYVAFCSWGE